MHHRADVRGQQGRRRLDKRERVGRRKTGTGSEGHRQRFFRVENGCGVPSSENWRLREAQLQRAQPRGRPYDELGSTREFESHRENSNTFRDAERNSGFLGLQQKRKWEQWIRHCCESSGQAKLDHRQQHLCLLKASTAREAEVAGAYILREVGNLVFVQQMIVDMVTICIEQVSDEMTKEQQ